MNLNVLPIDVMLSHSGQWLGNPELRAKIDAHLVGAALLIEVGRVHDRLAGHVERRRQLGIALTRLTDMISDFDVGHDDLARAIHFALEALIAASRNAAQAERYRRLQTLLFPHGPSTVSRACSHPAGAIAALQARLTDADVAELAAIPVGDATLADWYRAWIESGQALVRHIYEALPAGTGRGGSAVDTADICAARLDWVNTVQTFLAALQYMDLDQETRERIMGPLDASIAQALRSRTRDGQPGGARGDERSGNRPGGALREGPAPGSVRTCGPAPATQSWWLPERVPVMLAR